MAADGNAALGEKLHRLNHRCSAFQLDHLRASRHQFCSVRERFLRTDLKRAEWHIAHDESLLRSACYTASVIDHIVQRHWQRTIMPLQHHAERIAHQQHIHALRFEQRGKACVVASQHGDFFFLAAHGLQFSQCGSHH